MGKQPHHRRTPTPPAMPAPVAGERALAAGVWAVTALALLAPFIGGLWRPVDFFEPPFDTTLRRLALFAMGGWLVAWLVVTWARAQRIAWRPHLLDLLAGLFLVGLLLSAARSPYPQVAFFGPLWSQMALPFAVTGLLLYLAVRSFARAPDAVERIAAALVLAGGIVALLGLIDRFDPRGVAAAFDPPRLAGLLRNPMFTGLYLAMLVPLGIGVALATTRRPLAVGMLLCAGVMTVALVLTLARGAWLGFAAAMLLLGMAVAWRARGALSRPVKLAAGAAVVVLVATALALPAVRARLQSMVNLRDATVQSRLVYMESAWAMFRARPLSEVVSKVLAAGSLRIFRNTVTGYLFPSVAGIRHQKAAHSTACCPGRGSGWPPPAGRSWALPGSGLFLRWGRLRHPLRQHRRRVAGRRDSAHPHDTAVCAAKQLDGRRDWM